MKKEIIKESAEMPKEIYNIGLEQQISSRLNDCLSDLHYAIMDLREVGVTVNSVEDIRRTTSEQISKQLEKDKAAYFKNMTYVPKTLKRQADEEFLKMKSELLPLADALQKAFGVCPLPIIFKESTGATGDYCVTFEDKAVKEYVNSIATVTIAEEFREYFTRLQAFICAWDQLKDDAEKLGICVPNGNLIRELMNARAVFANGLDISNFGTRSDMSLNVEKMFELIRSGVIHRASDEIQSD